LNTITSFLHPDFLTSRMLMLLCSVSMLSSCSAAGTLKGIVKEQFSETCATEKTSGHGCFGAVGSNCDKVQDPCPAGQQSMSVGSLSHDLCCRWCGGGVFCSEPDISKFLSDSVGDDKACAYEWRKAVWNILDKRGWCVDQSAMSTNNSDVSELPMSDGAQHTFEYDVSDYWGHKVGRRSLEMVTATRNYCAPAKTNLDCLGCDQCGHTESGRRRFWTSRRRSTQPCMAGSGDSQFCCSGKFSKVSSAALGLKTWGQCA